MSLVILTGASGAGKTAIASVVATRYPDIAVIGFDSIGVPSAERMIASSRLVAVSLMVWPLSGSPRQAACRHHPGRFCPNWGPAPRLLVDGADKSHMNRLSYSGARGACIGQPLKGS